MAWLSLPTGRIRSAARLSVAERRLALRAHVWLMLARAARPWASAWWLRRALGADTSALPVSEEAARAGRRAMTRAARTFSRTNCLDRALAGVTLLRRSGCQADLRIGVRRDDREPFGAHAWVESAAIVVVGDEAAMAFVPLDRTVR